MVSLSGVAAFQGEIKPSEVFAYVYSETVSLKFREPVTFDHMFMRVSDVYLEMYQKEHGRRANRLTLYVETYGQDLDSERLLFRHEIPAAEVGWVRVHAPHRNMAQVTRMVFS